MDVVIEFTKLILPSALVLYAMYLTMRSMMQKELKSKTIDFKVENNKIVMPLRLQAYERMCLFLERIYPPNLLPRLNEPGLSAKAFQSVLVKQIREEFNHNLSQQIYMSNAAWQMIKNTTEEVVTLINTAAEKTGNDGKSTDLAREIISLYAGRNEDPINKTLEYVKEEIRESF